MHRRFNCRFTSAALIAACLCLAAALTSTPGAATSKNREGRVLADLYCRSEYEDARRNADYLRGSERKEARRIARQRFEECHKKARKAHQVEDVMPRLIPR